jgi:hypothetical protein
VHAHNTAAAAAALPSMDAAIFVLTADPPVSASERDLLDEAALAEATEFTSRVVAEATGAGAGAPAGARAVRD